MRAKCNVDAATAVAAVNPWIESVQELWIQTFIRLVSRSLVILPNLIAAKANQMHQGQWMKKKNAHTHKARKRKRDVCFFCYIKLHRDLFVYTHFYARDFLRHWLPFLLFDFVEVCVVYFLLCCSISVVTILAYVFCTSSGLS